MASDQTFSGQIKHLSGQIKFGQTNEVTVFACLCVFVFLCVCMRLCVCTCMFHVTCMDFGHYSCMYHVHDMNINMTVTCM